MMTQLGFTNFLLSTISILVLGILFSKYLKYRRWFAKFELIPGPPCLPILGNALQVLVNRKDVANSIFEKFDTYGPLFRAWFGPLPTVNLSRAEDIEVLLNSSKHIEKSFFYTFLEPWLGDGLLLAKGARWHAHRKLFTPAFHFNILEAFNEVFKAKSDILVNTLEKYSETKEQIDIFEFISHTTLDIICETAMGTNINAQSEVQSDYVKSIYDIATVITDRSRRLWLYPNFIFSLTQYSKIYNECLEILHAFTQNVIRKRKLLRKSNNNIEEKSTLFDDDGKKKRIAFLDILLEAADNGANINNTSIREEVDTFMFEGHDTTASGISWTIFLLGHNPEHQELAYQELNEIFNGEDRGISIEDLSRMKYLERIVKESMRIYPPVPIIGRIMDEDTQIGKYMIPRSTGIGIFIHRLHRDSRYFPDPEKFDPDRFLLENCKERHPFAYIPFSAGSRNCIGQKFAMMEEKVVLASIIRKYKIKSIDKREDVHFLYELVSKSSEGIKIVLEKRSKNV